VLNKSSDSLKKYTKACLKLVTLKEMTMIPIIFSKVCCRLLTQGLVGLLIAIIFLAAWGSIAAALNSLASCTMIDFHKRFSKSTTEKNTVEQDIKEYRWSKIYTLLWEYFVL
jgi:hypothetical protein